MIALFINAYFSITEYVLVFLNKKKYKYELSVLVPIPSIYYQII